MKYLSIKIKHKFTLKLNILAHNFSILFKIVFRCYSLNNYLLPSLYLISYLISYNMPSLLYLINKLLFITCGTTLFLQ